MIRRGRAAVVLALALVLIPVAPGSVHADPDDSPAPSHWPASPALTAQIEGAAHAVRFAGPDRFQTGLALSLGLRGTGGFPFSTADRSSGNATSLDTASGWWGVGVCPRAVIVVAGDSPADALAASALADPTDQSSEPWLQRSAAADPLFDPIGGFTRVDTDSAPILVTRSARDGATTLSVAARVAAQDLRSGGCSLARQAIVVGGSAAVPAEVDDELVSIGYDEVFRVEGADRYATAAAIALSLGTSPPPDDITECGDVVVDDGAARMTFVANSVVEHRSSAVSCELLGRTVVLADGVTGADALAAGWWTSFWQVPVLLHDGDSTLRAPTAEALTSLDVDHVIILGGTARISDDVAAEVVSITGAEVIRVAGADRYATSVEMARRFGGWWPTGRADEFAGSLVCLAASSGEGQAARGWPDALASGPWCGAANGAAANPGAPDRALAPTTGGEPTTVAEVTSADRPAHDAVPILLVPFGATSLPAEIAGFLSQAFEPADDWCTSVSAAAGCHVPGFAVVFGGAAAIGDGVIAQVSSLVSGGAATDTAMAPPALTDPFNTGLDLGPVYAMGGLGDGRVCTSRNGYEGARWLAAFTSPTAAVELSSHDVMLDGRYVSDGDGVVRTPGVGAPACVAYDTTGRTSIAVRAVGLAGRASHVESFDIADEDRLAVLDPITSSSPAAASGVASDVDGTGPGSTARSFLTTDPSPGVAIRSNGQLSPLTSASLSVTLDRGADTDTTVTPDVFTASWTITTALGSVTGSAIGEAIYDAGVWELRGVSNITGSSWNIDSGRGGFTATLMTNLPGTVSDDAISWQLDAFAAD